jgi:hypothetical protein
MTSIASAAIEPCRVMICGQTKRGMRTVCGNPNCGKGQELPINTVRNNGGDDSEMIWKLMVNKFERIGWKIGKTPSQNRCPQCYTAIKVAQVRKHKEHEVMENKVIQMNSTAISTQTVDMPRGERPMSRDERRIITEKMLEVYLNETVGYKEDWSDEKVAKDMGVPRVWVAQVRDEAFGPEDKNERSTTLYDEAKDIMVQLKATRLQIEPYLQQVQKLMTKLDLVDQNLKKMMERRP